MEFKQLGSNVRGLRSARKAREKYGEKFNYLEERIKACF